MDKNCAGVEMIDIFVTDFTSFKQNEYTLLARSLPFGEAECERILSLKNGARALESAGALALLWYACKIHGVSLPLEIARAESGKPYFKGSDVRFNLSHSGKFAAAVLSFEGEIGLDIEVIDRTRNVRGIATRYFSEKELALFNSADDKAAEFFRTWTKKEARAKLYGVGLSSVIAAEKQMGDAMHNVNTQTALINGELLCASVCTEELADEPQARICLLGADEILNQICEDKI